MKVNVFPRKTVGPASKKILYQDFQKYNFIDNVFHFLGAVTK